MEETIKFMNLHTASEPLVTVEEEDGNEWSHTIHRVLYYWTIRLILYAKW